MSLLAELKMIISQRLLGVLCPSCSRPHILTDKEKEILSEKEIKMLTAEGTVLRERGSIEAQKKCPAKCLYGFAGRIAVAEIIEFNNHLRDALLRESRFDDVARVLNEHGFVSMWDKGLKLVSKGVVELSELIHVIGKED
jgi:type II secretory ATPase GspE/PulE/Tfp pilus assembly ATPase PilB-like protein